MTSLLHDSVDRPRAGSYSIRINDQWRIRFRIENNQALDVTIEDYH